MATTWVLIQFMRTTPPIFGAFKQNRYHIVDVGTVNDDQILDEESVRWVPSAVEDSWLKVEQVFDLFVVYLCIRGFDRVVALVVLDLPPKLLDRSWDNTFSLILLVHLFVENLLLPSHRVRLPWASLSIREHSCTISFNSSINQLIHIAGFVAHLLTEVLIHQVVKFVPFVNTSNFTWIKYLWFICNTPSFYSFRQFESPRAF